MNIPLLKLNIEPLQNKLGFRTISNLLELSSCSYDCYSIFYFKPISLKKKIIESELITGKLVNILQYLVWSNTKLIERQTRIHIYLDPIHMNEINTSCTPHYINSIDNRSSQQSLGNEWLVKAFRTWESYSAAIIASKRSVWYVVRDMSTYDQHSI